MSVRGSLPLIASARILHTNWSSPSGRTESRRVYTFVYSGSSSTEYVVCVANYQTTIFSHWGNGNTNPCKTAAPSANIVMTAYYSTGTSQLSITSQTTAGATIMGFWTELYNQSGSVLATGYTPVTYTLNNGQTYTGGGQLRFMPVRLLARQRKHQLPEERINQ